MEARNIPCSQLILRPTPSPFRTDQLPAERLPFLGLKFIDERLTTADYPSAPIILQRVSRNVGERQNTSAFTERR